MSSRASHLSRMELQRRSRACILVPARFIFLFPLPLPVPSFSYRPLPFPWRYRFSTVYIIYITLVFSFFTLFFYCIYVFFLSFLILFIFFPLIRPLTCILDLCWLYSNASTNRRTARAQGCLVPAGLPAPPAEVGLPGGGALGDFQMGSNRKPYFRYDVTSTVTSYNHHLDIQCVSFESLYIRHRLGCISS